MDMGKLNGFYLHKTELDAGFTFQDWPFFLFLLCLLPRCEITYTLINEIQAEQTREELLLFCFHAINPANFQKK